MEGVEVASGIFQKLLKEKYVQTVFLIQPIPPSHTDRKQMHEVVTTGLHSPSPAPFSHFPYFLPSDQFVKKQSFHTPWDI